MSDLDKKATLYGLDIPTPEGLDDIIAELTEDKSPFLFRGVNTPVFMYRENIVRSAHGIPTRDSRVERHITDAYGNGVMIGSVSRDVISIKGKSIDDTVRGKILNSFSELEYILNIMLLHAEGVYNGRITYADFYRGMMENFSAPFHSFESKKKYLKLYNYIKDDTYQYLSQAQKIRNHIAHQYFIDKGIGLSKKQLGEYDSQTEAIEIIFNKSWLYLVRDYNPLQVEILTEVKKRMRAAS